MSYNYTYQTMQFALSNALLFILAGIKCDVKAQGRSVKSIVLLGGMHSVYALKPHSLI